MHRTTAHHPVRHQFRQPGRKDRPFLRIHALEQVRGAPQVPVRLDGRSPSLLLLLFEFLDHVHRYLVSEPIGQCLLLVVGRFGLLVQISKGVGDSLPQGLLIWLSLCSIDCFLHACDTAAQGFMCLDLGIEAVIVFAKSRKPDCIHRIQLVFGYENGVTSVCQKWRRGGSAHGCGIGVARLQVPPNHIMDDEQPKA